MPEPPRGPGFAAQAAGLPRVTAATLTTIPDALTRHETPSEWAVQQGREPAIGSFLESPVFDPTGALWLCDVARGRIMQVDDGEWRVVASYDGAPNGLAFDPSGRLLVADHRRGLLSLHPPTGDLRPLLTGYGMSAFAGLNDVHVDSAGNTYLTDQGGTGLHDPAGKLLRLVPDGRIEVLVDTIPSPNAVAVDGCRRVAYVAVTRDNAVWRVPLGDGPVAKVGRFLALSGGIGPDGVALLPGGGLAVTHLGLGVVWCFDRRGVPTLAIDTPQGEDPTSAVVDPRDGALLITEARSGSVLRVAADALPAEETVRPPYW